MNKQTTQSTEGYAWVVWGLAVAFYAYEFFLQVSPNAMAHQLMHAFHVDGTALGNLSAFYFYSYAIMQIPVGILLDRYGPRWLLPFAMLICALGSYLFGAANELWLAELGRVLIGFGGAFAALGCLYVAALWHKPKHFPLLAGLMMTIGMAGAASGNSLLGPIINTFGWRTSLIEMGYIGFAISGVLLILLKNKKLPRHEEETHETVPFWNGLLYILKDKQVRCLSIYGGLIFASTSTFGGLWGIPFLESKYHLSKFHAGSLIALIFVGWAIGSPLVGILSERLRTRLLPLIGGSLLSALVMTGIIYIHWNSNFWLGLNMLLFGICASTMILIFTMGKESVPEKHWATAMGFINTLNMLGGVILEPLIGRFLDNYSLHQPDGTLAFSVHGYHVALSLLPISIFVSIILLFFIKETYR